MMSSRPLPRLTTPRSGSDGALMHLATSPAMVAATGRIARTVVNATRRTATTTLTKLAAGAPGRKQSRMMHRSRTVVAASGHETPMMAMPDEIGIGGATSKMTRPMAIPIR